MRSGSRCPAFYGENPPMRWGILNDDGGYFYCITYNRPQLQVVGLDHVGCAVERLRGLGRAIREYLVEVAGAEHVQ